MEGVQGIDQGDEVAELCVGKLRGMIAVEGDPNCKGFEVMLTLC